MHRLFPHRLFPHRQGNRLRSRRRNRRRSAAYRTRASGTRHRAGPTITQVGGHRAPVPCRRCLPLRALGQSSRMSDPQDMAEDLDDDVIGADPVTADEFVDGRGDQGSDDLSEQLIADELIGDDGVVSAEEAAMHVVEDT